MNSLRLRDGLELCYDVHGKGAPLVLVHGFMGSAVAWGNLPYTLANEFQVYVVDLPGHGRSGRSHDPARYELHAIAADLLELLDAHQIEKTLLAGYSMGGRIALGTAVIAPERIAALVLEGASPGLADSHERARRRAGDAALAAQLERDGLPAFVTHWLAQQTFHTQERLPADLRARERERRLGNDPRSLAACLCGLGTGAQPSYWKELSTLPVPALLLTGELDAKFRGVADQMARAWPGAERAVVPRAGHAAHLEAPDSWLAAALPFLRRMADRTRRRARTA
jgi:2-succinyl-6-hydroxy-2,4-cyclohexadiene-1-carboxylate synthase